MAETDFDYTPDDTSVLIIGAGHSRSLSEKIGFGPMPLIKDFMRIAHGLTIKGGTYTDGYADLWKFVEDFFHIPSLSDPTNKGAAARLSEVNVEEAMSILDVAAQHPDGFGAPKSYDPRVLSDTMRSLIYKTIANQSPFQGTEDSLKHLKAANESVMELLQKTRAANAISFNWDLLFDSTMASLPALKLWDWDHSYGFAPSLRFQGRQPHPERRGDDFHKSNLLKLHGSMNWGTCPACSTWYVYDAADLLAIQGAPQYPVAMKRCHRCHATLKLGIIPPTWLKKIEQWPFTAIWRKAFLALSGAKRITVVGYSLAPGDFFVRNLLVTARAAASAGPSLTLVDPAASNLLDQWTRAVHPSTTTTHLSLADFFAAA